MFGFYDSLVKARLEESLEKKWTFFRFYPSGIKGTQKVCFPPIELMILLGFNLFMGGSGLMEKGYC